MDFEAVKKLATRPVRTVPLYLDGETADEIEQLERRLEELPAPTSLGDSARQELAEQIVEAQNRMRESLVEFKLVAMPVRGPDSWTLFVARQPERAEKETDDAWQERIYPWYAEMVSRTVVEPAMSVEQVGELCDLLNNGSWMSLVNQCLDVNGRKLDVPNSEAASALTRNSGQT